MGLSVKIDRSALIRPIYCNCYGINRENKIEKISFYFLKDFTDFEFVRICPQKMHRSKFTVVYIQLLIASLMQVLTESAVQSFSEK